jgi:hypothetical protein
MIKCASRFVVLDLSLVDTFPENGRRLVATGDRYGSQSIVPVHFGLTRMADVIIEVTFLTRDGRRRKRIEGVDPLQWTGKALVVMADD